MNQPRKDIAALNNTFHRLLPILLLSVALRLGLAFYLGDATSNRHGSAAAQVSYDKLARRCC